MKLKQMLWCALVLVFFINNFSQAEENDDLIIVTDPRLAMGNASQSSSSSRIAQEDPYAKALMERSVTPKKMQKPMPPVHVRQASLPASPRIAVQGDAAGMQLAIEELNKEARLREEELKAEAQKNLASVQLELSEKANQMRQEAARAAEELKKKTEAHVQELIEGARGTIATINTQMEKEALKIKQEAATRALSVIDENERRAAQERREERKNIVARSFGISSEGIALGSFSEDEKKEYRSSSVAQRGKKDSRFLDDFVRPEPLRSGALGNAVKMINPGLCVSTEWKNDISRRFYKDMSALRDIVLNAESPEEARDFLAKCEEQNTWFDSTVRSIQDMSDERYAQLVAKQKQLNNVMQGQRFAATLVDQYTKNMTMPAESVKKIKLSLLYDVNDKVQQQTSHLDAIKRESPLDHDDIRFLVKKALSDASLQFREIAAQFPDALDASKHAPKITMDVHKAQQIQDELSAAKNSLNVAQKTIAVVQSERDKAQSIQKELAAQKEATAAMLNARVRGNLETEVALQGARQENSLLRQNLSAATEQSTKLTLAQRGLISDVERSKKEVLENTLQTKSIAVEARKEIQTIEERGNKEVLGLRVDVRTAQNALGVEQKRATIFKEALSTAEEKFMRGTFEADLKKQRGAHARVPNFGIRRRMHR